MTGTRRGDTLVFGRITLLNGQGFGPVLPVVVGQQERDGRADGLAVTHAAENARGIALDAHAPAAAVALLPSPEFAIDERQIDGNAGRHARKQRDQRLSVRFSGS